MFVPSCLSRDPPHHVPSLSLAAAVGTVSVRSLVEPLRKIAARLRGHLMNARAVDLVMSERLLEVQTIAPGGGQGEHMYIPCVSDFPSPTRLIRDSSRLA